MVLHYYYCHAMRREGILNDIWLVFRLGLELEKVHGDPVSYASRQNIYLSNVLGYSNDTHILHWDHTTWAGGRLQELVELELPG